MRLLLVIVALLLCALPSLAGGYADGFVEDGYAYNVASGYWFKGGYAYSRTRIDYSEPYVYCGRTYYQPYYYHRYTKVLDASTVKPSDPDFRVKLLEIAKQRDAIEGAIRKSANQHNEFLESVQALGLSGNFTFQGYGQAPSYANPLRYGSLQYGAYGQQNAATIYTYKEAVDAYNTLDPNVLFQQSASLTKGAQALAGQANTEFTGLVDRANAGIQRAAEIDAAGRASSAALAAARAAPQTSTQSSTTVIQPTPLVPQQLPPGDDEPAAMPKVGVRGGGRLPFPAANACVSCHYGASAAAKFDISLWKGLPDERKGQIIRDHLLTTDQVKLMPRQKNGSPGPRLTLKQVREFAEN